MAAGSSSGSSEFRWGERVVNSTQSYESMCFKGIWYSLHDCVYVKSDTEEPHLGKLMRLFEEGDDARKIRVRWFLRASELPLSVSRDLSGKNKTEVFIAQGGLKGVENENSVDVILGKAIVLCTAKCPRNPQPSQLHVDGAHYFFNKVYDVSKRKLVKIEMFERHEKSLALKFFNKLEWLVVVETTPLEDARSPTSVRDFDMAKKRLSSNAGGACGADATEFKKLKRGS